MSDGEAVAGTVARARRRLIAATFLRWTCCAMAVGVAGRVMATLLAGQPLAPGRQWLAISAIALVLGVTVAAWRRPTPARTAAALDARLGLPDLAIAAYVLRNSPHPMAQLVVRDARQRLASASLPRVLPMPRRLATWTSGASIAALLLGALAGGGSAPAGNLVPAGGAGRVVSGGGAAMPRANAAAASSASAGRSSAPRPQPAPGQGANRPQPVETPAAGSQARPSAAAARSQQAGARGSDGAAPAPGRTAGRSGSAGRGAADGQAMPGAAAGGVQLGAVARDATAAPALPVDGPPTTDDLHRAARRAEAALARDEIPPRMKPTVRRYFQSLQPESGR